MLKNVEMYLLHVIPFVFGFSEVNLLKSCTVCTSPQIASTGSMRFTFVTNQRNDDTCSIILFMRILQTASSVVEVDALRVELF